MQRAQAVGTVITGATGFVGGELLVTLLAATNRHLICPIRANSDEAAADRGAKRLSELTTAAKAAELSHRVEWIRGDIEESQLGWSDMRWHDVAMRTDEIFHCAASVSFDLPLEQAQRINVDGTKHVFALAQAAGARHKRFRRFHHVSTAYVAGKAKGRVDADYLPEDKASEFRNTYERTKARAERFLRSEASAPVPVSIHRPSIIAGNSQTGETTNWNVLYVPMKMAARGVLPTLPRGGRELADTIGVDFLVNAMITFSQLDSKPLESHHVTAGPTAFTLTDLIRTTAEQARLVGDFKPSHTRFLGPLRWRALTATVEVVAKAPKWVGRYRKSARIARRGLQQCAPYVPYMWVNVIFDTARDHDTLRIFGVEMPPGPEFLDTLIDYALATNFGKTVKPATDVAVV